MFDPRGGVVKSILRIVLAPLPVPVDPAHAGPGLHLGWRLGWIKGLLVRALLAVRGATGGTRVRGGRRLVVRGRLRVRGPGRIVLGDDLIIADRTDIYTHARDALVTIGDRSYLNGTRFGCARAITVGPGAILADARFFDTDMHPLGRDRHSKAAPIGTAPVVLGSNVWVGAGAFVLKGITIGDHSVVAAASVVTKDVPPDTIVGGNPARPLGTVPEVTPRTAEGP